VIRPAVVALLGATAIATANASAAAAPARRDVIASELALAGADAPIVVRADASGVHDLIAALRARVPALLRGPLDDALASLAQQLGGDPFAPAGWTALGFDPSRPMVVAIGRTTGPDVLAFAGERDPLVPGGAPPSPTKPTTATLAVEVRVVIPIGDAAIATRTGARLASMLREASIASADATIDASSRTLVLAISDTRDDRAKARLAPRAPASARLRDPTAAALTNAAPIAVHVEPLRLAETMFWRRARGGIPAAPTHEIFVTLRDLARPIAPMIAGPIGHAGAAIEIHGDAIHADLTVAIAPRSPLAITLARTVDSALPRAADTPDAALHLHSYLADVAALSELPSAGMTFDLPPEPFFPYGGLSPLIEIVSAPYALGAAVTHVAHAEPAARPMLAGIRDAALVIDTVGTDFASSRATLEVAVTRDASTALQPLLSTIWGTPATAAFTSWGQGPIRPFARTLGATTTVGVAIRDSAASYLQHTRTSPAPPRGTVLELHATAAALALVHPIASLAGTLDATARWDGRALHIDATIAP